MTYLSRDNRNRGGGINRAIAFVLFAVLLFIIFIAPHFFSGLFYNLGQPVFKISTAISGSPFFDSFRSKTSLIAENQNLTNALNEARASLLNYNVLQNENTELREILNRREANRNLVLANILVRPPESPYDTFVLDIGADHGIKAGDQVLAFGNIAVGQISAVFNNSSTATLYSSGGTKSAVLIETSTSTIAADAMGKGGSNFEITLPVGTEVNIGDSIILSDSKHTYLGQVGSINSPANAAFMTVLFQSPVNARNLSNLEVVISS